MARTWTHGPELRAFREKALQISQQAAATTVGVSLGAYGAWERGSAVPTRESLHDLVELMGVPPDLIGYDPPTGWDLVPSDWVRAEIAGLHSKLDTIIDLLEHAPR